MKRKLLTMSALALVCGVSVACSSNTSANVNTNSANTNIAQENTSSQNIINNNNTNFSSYIIEYSCRFTSSKFVF